MSVKALMNTLHSELFLSYSLLLIETKAEPKNFSQILLNDLFSSFLQENNL